MTTLVKESTIKPGQLVEFRHGHFHRMVWIVKHVVPDSHPSPDSKNQMVVVHINGQQLLKRASELRPSWNHRSHSSLAATKSSLRTSPVNRD